jgi:hypothetical protein
MADQPAGEPDEGVEVLNAVLVDQELRYSINSRLFEDPASWGELFAALARDVAKTLQAEDKADPAAVLRQVKEAFVAGLEAEA